MGSGRTLYVSKADDPQINIVQAYFPEIGASITVNLFSEYSDAELVASHLLQSAAEPVPRLRRGLRHSATFTCALVGRMARCGVAWFTPLRTGHVAPGVQCPKFFHSSHFIVRRTFHESWAGLMFYILFHRKLLAWVLHPSPLQRRLVSILFAAPYLIPIRICIPHSRRSEAPEEESKGSGAVSFAMPQQGVRTKPDTRVCSFPPYPAPRGAGVQEVKRGRESRRPRRVVCSSAFIHSGGVRLRRLFLNKRRRCATRRQTCVWKVGISSAGLTKTGQKLWVPAFSIDFKSEKMVDLNIRL